MRKYFIAHKGYTFWLTYSHIIPMRLDKTVIITRIVEIWRGLDAVDTENEPLFKSLKELTGTGKNDRAAMESIHAKLEALSEELKLEPLTEGVVEIQNRTIASHGDSSERRRRPQNRKRKPQTGEPRKNQSENNKASKSSGIQEKKAGPPKRQSRSRSRSRYRPRSSGSQSNNGKSGNNNGNNKS